MKTILILALLVTLVGFFTIPIGKWMVDDRYIYNVKTISDIAPGVWLGSTTSTSETLTCFGYLMAKRKGFLYEKITD